MPTYREESNGVLRRVSDEPTDQDCWQFLTGLVTEDPERPGVWIGRAVSLPPALATQPFKDGIEVRCQDGTWIPLPHDLPRKEG